MLRGTTPADISIIIPAFNEATRLPPFLDRLMAYCQQDPRIYELIVVDDGSTDETAALVAAAAGRCPGLSLIRLRRNRGKGYAVKRGLFAATGWICAVLDADGSVDPEEIGRNLHELTDGGYDLFAGSRVVTGPGQVLTVARHRKLIGMVFNFLVQSLLFRQVKDTQCGFKLLKRALIKPVFSRCAIHEFGFDIEMLYLAQRLGFRIKEGPVSWRHTAGSKTNLATDSLAMFLNILQVRWWHSAPSGDSVEGALEPGEYRAMYELERTHWWFASKNEFIRRQTLRLNLADPVILDVGAGTGATLLAVQPHGRPVGLDVSAEALAFCARRGLRALAQAAAERICCQPGSVDLIICSEVLEHVDDPHAVLGELRQALRPGGALLVTVPALRWLWSRHDQALFHRRRYARRTLGTDLEEAGFRVERVGHLFFATFFLVAPMRILQRVFTGQSRPLSDTAGQPPRVVNALLARVCAWEAWLSERLPLPVGTSLYAVASKDPVWPSPERGPAGALAASEAPESLVAEAAA